MSLVEYKLLDTLKELKEKYGLIGLKSEFEAEGAKICDVFRLKQMASKLDLELTIKIGGCYAKKDIFEATEIGADAIVAPMIETKYAFEKFAKLANNESKKYFINIETITGFKNFDSIISDENFNKMTGVVFGRCDMVGSLGLTKNDCDSSQLLELAQILSNKMSQTGKILTIGGGMSPKSVNFLKQIPYISRFETRKTVFNAQLNDKTEIAISKALEFEIMWLKSKNDFTQEDEERCRRLNKLILQTQLA